MPFWLFRTLKMLSFPFLSHCHPWFSGQTLGDTRKGSYELLFCLWGNICFFSLAILPEVYFCRFIAAFHPHTLVLSIPPLVQFGVLVPFFSHSLAHTQWDWKESLVWLLEVRKVWEMLLSMQSIWITYDTCSQGFQIC